MPYVCMLAIDEELLAGPCNVNGFTAWGIPARPSRNQFRTSCLPIEFLDNMLRFLVFELYSGREDPLLNGFPADTSTVDVALGTWYR